MDDALAHVKRNAVFTIHTPVSAGNERFDAGLVRTLAAPSSIEEQMNLTIEEGGGESPDQASVKALVTSGDRRVDGEYRIAPDVVVRVDQRLAFGEQLAGALDEQECGVTFIEVPDSRVDAQRAQSAHATHAQHDLLVQAHLAPTHVQDVRDRPVGVVVVRNVRIEQQQRHPADLGQPNRAPDRPAGQLHANVQRSTVGVAHAQHGQT